MHFPLGCPRDRGFPRRGEQARDPDQARALRSSPKRFRYLHHAHEAGTPLSVLVVDDHADTAGNKYVLIDGSWYVDGMPEALITCTRDRRRAKSDPERISKKQLMDNIAAREKYRLIPHGRRDSDGFQRYRLPDPNGYVLYDRDNPQRIVDKPTVKTVTIPLSEGIEWHQKHPYLS